jgi:hypothetical protein
MDTKGKITKLEDPNNPYGTARKKVKAGDIRPTPIKKEAKVVPREPPSRMDRLKAVAAGVKADVRQAIDDTIPAANRRYNDFRKKRIEEAVEGREPTR